MPPQRNPATGPNALEIESPKGKVMLVADLASETTISWDIFKHDFNRHFFPRAMQEVKAREFLDLSKDG
jgi:hypothetical protein